MFSFTSKQSMASLLLIVATAVFASTLSAESVSYPAYFYPLPMEHQNALVALKDTFPADAYDYTIVPVDQNPNYAVVDKPSTGLSLWDCIPDPITAITTIGSTALSVTLYLLPQVIWMAVGAVLVIGFCAFTPYCTLIFEKPFSNELRSLGTTCLDYAEDLFVKAYEKFNEI